MNGAIVTVYLGLGSNLGDRQAQIYRGLDLLELRGAARIRRVSSLYESEPVGWDGGPWYLNGAAVGETALDPMALLRSLKEVEAEMGRVVGERNAPRPLDLDLLLYGSERITALELVVPHPGIRDRAFVLWPMAEIAPEVEVAPGLTATEAKKRLKSHEAIRLWEQVD